MALIKCYECGKQVSDQLKRCIYCGAKLKSIKKSTIATLICTTLVVVSTCIILAVNTFTKSTPHVKNVVEQIDVNSTTQLERKPIPVELSTENISKYLTFNAYFENMQLTGTSKNFLGFNEYTYSINLNLDISAILDKKFNNVVLKFTWQPKDEAKKFLYDQFYYSARETTIALNENGEGKAKMPLQGSFPIRINPPSVEPGEIIITHIEGVVYE